MLFVAENQTCGIISLLSAEFFCVAKPPWETKASTSLHRFPSTLCCSRCPLSEKSRWTADRTCVCKKYFKTREENSQNLQQGCLNSHRCFMKLSLRLLFKLERRIEGEENPWLWWEQQSGYGSTSGVEICSKCLLYFPSLITSIISIKVVFDISFAVGWDWCCLFSKAQQFPLTELWILQLKAQNNL